MLNKITKMKLALMQPYFLPYIGAFQLIHSVDKYVFMGYLNYRKDAWYHKNRMIIRNQGPTFFSLKLVSKSSYKSFHEISVDPSRYWRNKLLKTIEQNYVKTPYYDECISLFRNVINADILPLDEFNSNSMIEISKFLRIDTVMEQYPDEYLAIESRLQSLVCGSFDSGDNVEEQNIDLKTRRVLEICKYENATIFNNAIGGVSLYSKEVFESHGIILHFIKTKPFEYKQAWKSFSPNMSILDVLMNCGKEKTIEYLSMYSLV